MKSMTSKRFDEKIKRILKNVDLKMLELENEYK